MRDGRVRSSENGLSVEAGLVACGDGGELDVAAGGDEEGVEAAVDRLVTGAEGDDQDVVSGIGFLDRAAEDEVLADVELDLSALVVDLEDRVRFHHEGAVQGVDTGAVEL